jgi:hypothetical protein
MVYATGANILRTTLETQTCPRLFYLSASQFESTSKQGPSTHAWYRSDVVAGYVLNPYIVRF